MSHTTSKVQVYPSATIADTGAYISRTCDNEFEIQVDFDSSITDKDGDRHYLSTEIRLTESQWREAMKAVGLLITHKHLTEKDGSNSGSIVMLYEVKDAIAQAEQVAQAQYDSERESFETTIVQGISLA